MYNRFNESKLQVRFLFTLVIIKKTEMGQNARAIEEVVVNLENQKLISPEQAQQFIKDYQTKSPRIDEVHKFIQQPNLTYFLKYYIGTKYNSHIRQQNKKKPQWGSSRSQIEEEVLEMAEIQMKNKVIDMIKSEEKRIVSSIKQCCEVVIQQNYDIFKSMIKKLLKQNMEIQQFQIVVKNNQCILTYQSDIDYINSIHPESLQWSTLIKNFSLSHKNRYQYDQVKDQFVLYFNQQISKYVIKFRVSTNLNHSLYQSLLSKQSTRQKITKILIKLLQYFDYHSPYLSMLTKFCLHTFEIIQVGAQIMQQQIKVLISSLMGPIAQQLKNNGNIIDFIKESVNSDKKVSRKQIICSIEKKYKNVSRELKVIDSYTQMIQNQQFFFDFDKYSELRFCFVHKYHAFENKLKSCWAQERIKVIDIMCEHPDLLSKLVEVAKNQQKHGIIQQSSSSYTYSIFTGENGLLERVLILFDKMKSNKKKGLQLSQNCTEETNLKEKENNKSTSKMQQKIVKDLQKQDPNIRKTGWLKLFVKQANSFEPVFNQKEQSKLSVTDIQKIDGIDNKLNVLDLSEKQLLLSVWSIMKTNPLFSILVKDEQTEVKFTNFLNELNYHYSVNNNKFHNFYHAINVLHMCSILSNSQIVSNTLTNVEMFSVLMSGLCHDVGHTGFSNSYEIVSFSQRAITYNDNSPLQNFQASKTIQILKNSQNNFLQKMERDKYIQFKQNLIHNILSTDLNQHFIVLDKFKEWSKLPKDQAKTQCSALTAMIVHTSDYAGTCKEFSIAQQWSHRLNLEFMNQQESERKLGIKNTQSGFNYINNVISNNQMSFIEIIVLPLYEEISNFQVDNTFLPGLIELLKNNKSQWQGLSQKQ